MKNSKADKTLTGNGMSASWKIIGRDDATEMREFDERKLYESGSIEKITIDSKVVEVRIVSANVLVVDIHFSGKANVDSDIEFKTELVGNELRIEVNAEEICRLNNLKLDVIVPRTSFKAITIVSDSGDVCVENEDVITYKLDVKTSSGKIDIRKGVCVKRILLETSTGNVCINHIYGNERMIIKTSTGRISIGQFVWSGFIDLKTQTGSIEMVGVAAEDVEAQTISGKISVSDSFFIKRLKMQSSTGNITIDDGDVSKELKIKTVSGNVKAKLTSTNNIVNTTTGNIGMYIDADQNIKVYISTQSGKVVASFDHIKKMNLSAKSSTGKVKNRHVRSLLGYNADVNVSTLTGNIEVS